MQGEKLGRWLLWGNCLVLAAFYLGLDVVFRHWELDVFSALVWGYLGVTLFCSPFFVTRSKRIRTEINNRKWLLILSICITALSSWLWVSAIGAAGSGPVSLIENSQTLFALGLGIFFLHEKITIKESLAGLVILIGVFLVSMLQGEVPLWAAFATVGSAFIFALQSFLIKKYGKGMHSGTFSYLRSVGLAIIYSIIAVSFGLLNTLPWVVIILLGLLYVLGAVVARYFFFEAHKYLPISQINLLILVIPVMVLLGTFFIFHDPISLQKIIGTALVLGGTLWFVRERNYITKKSSSEEERL